MNCTKHFLFLKWTRHSWRRSVSWAEDYTAPQFDMWGRVTTDTYTTCQKQYFCSCCGKTKSAGYCGCDKAKAEQCALHRAWAAGAPAAPQVNA